MKKKPIVAMLLLSVFLVAGHVPAAADEPSAEHRTAASGEPSEEAPSEVSSSYRVLQAGDRGDDVKKLQAKLIELGYLNDKADGIFGSRTAAAVKLFNESNDLRADAVADVVTQEYLFNGPASAHTEPWIPVELPYTEWSDISDQGAAYRVKVTNLSGSRTIREIELQYYPSDVRGNDLWEDPYRRTSFAMTIAPGETAFTDWFYLSPSWNTIDTLHWGVSKIVFDDGTVHEEDDVTYWGVSLHEEAEEGNEYPSVPHMSLEEYPEVDGSLACIPLMKALVMEVTGCTEREAEESLEDFSNTNPSYERLMGGEAELILSYEASTDTKENLREEEGSGENELDLRPVGRDALVFIVNAGNPVEGLTTQQIHDIYTGEITNWSEVGGEDVRIKAFQRRENSGSQTLMRLLLMGDEEIPEKQMVSIAEMEGLLNTVMEYDNSANAIGYSVYYYASVMMGNDRLKFLAVDGVSPDNEAIRSGEYRLSNPFYCGISGKSGENALQIRDWLLSEEGQRFVEDNGYVGVGTVSSANSSEKTAATEGEEMQLFDPDLYLGIGTGTYRSAGGEAADMMVRYYDSTGTFHGEAPGTVDYYMGTFNLIEKNRLLFNYENDEIIILRTEDFEEVCRYNREDRYEGRAIEARDHIGVLSEDGSHLFIYDREGQICADLKTEAPAAGASGTDGRDWLDLVLYEPEGCLYVRLTMGEETLLTALVSEDGRVQTSADASFPELLSGRQVCGYIGGYLIVSNEQNEYEVVDTDGEILYTDVLLHWSENSAFATSYVMTGAHDEADFAAVREGETWRILNTALEEAGSIREEDLDDYGHLRYARGTIIGLPCEDLGGAVSTDKLRYLRTDIPAAKTADGWQIAEELGGFLPDPEKGWELVSFSDDFILTRKEEMQRVLRREDGQVLCETDRMIFLQNTTFVVEKSFTDPDSETVIYDGSGEERYSSAEQIFPCMDDWYFLRLGPWAGVMDADGKWILRELQYDE